MAIAREDVLICWIGGNDLKSTQVASPGPIMATIKDRSFDRIELLYSYPDREVNHYLAHLCRYVNAPVTAHKENLSSPIVASKPSSMR